MHKDLTLQAVVDSLSLHVLAGAARLNRPVTGGYTSDLLSRVMGQAKAGNIWVTMQGHPNVVAVASLLDLAAVVVTEDAPVEEDTLRKAEEHGVPILATAQDSFTVVAKLGAMGVQGTC